MNTVNLNIFQNHSGVYRFVKRFDKIYGDESPMAPNEIEVISFRVILKQQYSDNVYLPFY